MTLSQLYARKHEINAQLDAQFSNAFDNQDSELLTELHKVCDRIDAIEEREIYANLSPCNF